ncbi:SdrD B-like domain-containing protein [Leptothoe sp. EHU-05/26/07-4]
MDIKSLGAALPEQLTLKAINRIHRHYSDPNDPNDSTYVDLVIEDGGVLNGTYGGFCIDSDRDIGFGVDENFNGIIDANTNEVGSSYSAKVYSSYEPLPDELVGQGLIEKPENLDLLNWIINQDFTQQTSPSGSGNYTWADLQRAVWTLIDDENSTAGGIGEEGDYWQQERVDEIVAAARANGEGFVPSYGQKMGIIIVPDTDGDGAPDAQVQFAAIELAKLGDKVFVDSNRNGIQDATEVGVAGTTVNLLTDVDGDGTIEADEVIDSTTTDSNGEYHFTVVAGDYKVQFETPDGFEFTDANTGNDALDSDADTTTGLTHKITLDPGEYDSTIDAGIVSEATASLGDRVWYDTNKNGIQDAGEQGVADVKVTLTGGGADGIIGNADDTTAETVTDANGNYAFTNLNAGEEYKVTFSHLPQGYTFTQANADDMTTEEVVFESSFESVSNGSFIKAPLEGWRSKDGYLELHYNHSADGNNHIELNDDRLNYYNDTSQIYRNIATETGKQYTLTFQSAARPGYNADVNALEVRLDGATLLEVKEDGTQSSGLNWKTYTVTFEGDGTTKQLEFLSTGIAQNYGRGARLDDIKLVASSGSNNDAIDSDANPDNGMTQIVTLAAGEHNSTLDAGLVKTAVCAKLVGTEGINEGKKGRYFVELDGVSDVDRYFTVQVNSGSAKMTTDYRAGYQDIMWGGYYDTRNRWGRVIKKTYGYIAQGRAGYTGDDRKAIGPGDASWDYTVYDQNGHKDYDGVIQVKVAAGQTKSETFHVQTWKEKVTVDWDAPTRNGYYEGTERFSVSLVSGDADKLCGDHIDVSIRDRTHYDFFSPIALDLNGDGVQTTAMGATIGTFDLLGTGTAIESGWLSGADAFLAVDNNGNGIIDDISELFGGEVGEGFAKLQTFDTNGDGLIGNQEILTGGIILWQDANENHTTDKGELITLGSQGITSLNTSFEETPVYQHGNVLIEHGSANKVDGSQIDMVDAYFQVPATASNHAETMTSLG